MARSVPAENLREGTTIRVNGEIAYSHVTSAITGQKLEKRIADQRARGSRYPTTQPHTTISIVDPVVVPTGPDGAFTPEEQFVADGIYTAGPKSKFDGRQMLDQDSRGEKLPPILEKQSDGSYAQVQPDGELVQGLNVTVLFNVYKPRNYEKRGLGISTVLVNEPVRTFGSNIGAVADALAAAGITVSGGLTAPTANTETTGPTFDELRAAAAEDLPLPGVYNPATGGTPAPAVPVTPAPAAPPVDPDDHIARLTAELAAAQAAKAQAGAIPVPTEAALKSPWDVDVEV